MANYRVAKRYSKGLWDFANTTNSTEEVYQEMKHILNLFDENKDFKVFLKSPVIDFKRKQTVAKEVFKSFSDITQKFVQLVIAHKRERNLQEIAKHYVLLNETKNNVQQATLTSAVELNQASIDLILQKSQFINNDNPIKLKNKIDASLIGGFILRVGDKQYDASIRTKLNNLRNKFDENLYVPKI